MGFTIVSALAAGRLVSDLEFDRLLPRALRPLSDQHWTPVETAIRAAELLSGMGASQVLDVGSGAGKFCIIGALTTRAEYTGIEQRPHLVEVARSLVARHRIPRADFVHGQMEDLDWAEFDGIYFFNPFHEHLTPASDAIDESIELAARHYRRHTRRAHEKLAELPSGVTVATYHGLGVPLPDCYELVQREPSGTLFLELWVKRTQRRSARALLGRTG